MNRKHWIPHPLIGNDDKTKKMWIAEQSQEWETLQEYVGNSPNPKWAVSHLIRAIAAGLLKHDGNAASMLLELANTISIAHPVTSDKTR